jgi:hypothetical protein
MANRTVIVDNNTWNNTHIATVGTAMSSPEKAAWDIFNSLDVKYVLVVFGGDYIYIYIFFFLGIEIQVSSWVSELVPNI